MARREPEHFWYDGVDSRTMGIWLEEPIEIPGGTPRVERISVPGRSGELIIYDGGYDNVTFSAKCFLVTDPHTTAVESLLAVKQWLCTATGYRRFEMPGDDGYRMAYLTEPPSYMAKSPGLRTFTLKFCGKPQVYTYEGEQAVDISTPTTLYNPGMPALPYITVYGSGAGTVTVSGTVVDIQQLDGYLVLDCERQDAYRGTENANSQISAPEFPVLSTGENTVAFSGGVERLEIIPGWWHL